MFQKYFRIMLKRKNFSICTMRCNIRSTSSKYVCRGWRRGGGGEGDSIWKYNIFLKILMSNNFTICQVFRLPSFERLFTFLKRNIGDKLINLS